MGLNLVQKTYDLNDFTGPGQKVALRNDSANIFASHLCLYIVELVVSKGGNEALKY